TTVAALATQLYTAGWPEGIRVDALGALYDKSQSVQSTLGLEAANATDGNAQLHFSDGQLTKDIVKTNFNITGSTVATLKDSSYTLAPVAASGTFSGTFTPNWTNPDKVKPAFKGILIQKGASKGGYGFFISNAKSDLDPQSGGVTLGGPKTEFTEVAVEGMPRKSWTAVATSTDGSKIVVVGQFCMVTSTDSGATWQTRDDSRLWASVASSADGTRLIAGTYAGEVWISINSGATWTQSLSGLVHSMSVASSANGVKLAAAARDGAIWISHDSGATWAAKSNSQRWTSIGSSADGTVLVAGDQDTGAWTSLDSGATWTQRTPTDKLAGYSVAISSDGSKMSSTDGWNQVWVSNDSGMTWTQAPSEVSGYSSVVTKNGSKIVALAYGTMSTSTDSGLTWTTQSYSSNYRSIAFAANGKPVLTAEFDGLLYRWE
ncbi:MAG TPA: sialidase family protein, partial [Prosthecobacter sp.]|nr:sialidase family protein [Prosthecobacter sp.]